jgi:probable phosphoglycerate mutase
VGRTLLYLVRHGEQRADGAGLSDVGREQAELIGHRLAAVPFATVHHSPLARAAETADIVGGHLSGVPVHACELIADRTPYPSGAAFGEYPAQFHPWLAGVPQEERDSGAVQLRAAVEHFGAAGDGDRHELLITHNFVIGWFVRHVMDAPVWRWIGLNQANCGLTIVQWQSGRPPTLVCFNDVGHL